MPENVRDILDEGAFAIRKTIGDTVCTLTDDKVFKSEDGMRLANRAAIRAANIAVDCGMSFWFRSRYSR